MPQLRIRARSPHGSITIHVTYESWVAIVAISGDVDSSNVARLRAAVDEVTQTGHDLLVDLTDCPFVDSSGLSQLLRAQQLARAQDAAFGVVCQDGGVPARVLDIVCAGSLPIHHSRHEAFHAMRRSAVAADEPFDGTEAAGRRA